MLEVKQDFETRKQEVELYFAFLSDLEQKAISISQQDQQGNPLPYELDTTLSKTLKATGFLLLYNLVESTMSNGINAIFDELKQKNVDYDSVTDELKKKALQNIKNNKTDELCSKISNISVDILSAGFNPRNLFTGNVDAKKIREVAMDHGFSSDTDGQTTKGGEKLLTIKTNRNDLAHGLKSFSEVGREHGISGLLEIKNETIAYLEAILANIENYISFQEYLASNSSALRVSSNMGDDSMSNSLSQANGNSVPN